MKKKLRIKIWNKYDQHCAYCGQKLEYKDMQVDHIIPKVHGGIDEIKNFVPSCRPCNFYKSDFSLEDFRKNLKTIQQRILKIFIVKLAVRFGILTIKPFDGKFYFEKLEKKK